MPTIDKKDKTIKKLLEEKEAVEKKISELETYRAVALYKLSLERLKGYEDILSQLNLTRYSEESLRLYEPISYGTVLPGHRTYQENVSMRDHVSLETFLRRTLFYAAQAGKKVLSYKEVKDFHDIVLEEFQKDVAYPDEPYRSIASDIQIYLDPKANEIDFFNLNEELFDNQNTVFIGDVAVTHTGYLFFCPVVRDMDQLEQEVGLSSFKTEREKAAFTSKRVEDFFGITFDKNKQKIKKTRAKE